MNRPDISADGEEDLSSSVALKVAVQKVLSRINDQTDIVLDTSSLPRVAYLGLMLSILAKIVPNRTASGLSESGINFQVLVAEDAKLDSQIHAQDPGNDLVLIPGYSSALQVESYQEWPLVWFPILGEGRVTQLEKINSLLPETAEICPIVPHPSQNPRRGDNLVTEYMDGLFKKWQIPLSNVLHAHEGHPFEAYRQLLEAMVRYKDSLVLLGGCRLVVTPLASKLITVGAGLACFEMKPPVGENFEVAIPNAEPMRYVVDKEDLSSSEPTICALLLTGCAYSQT